MALKIYLIRHGKTAWNLAGKIQGSSDILLEQEGIDGAKQVGKALADVPLKAAYSSMLKRTHQTANHILGERDVPHFHHEGLNELDFGEWEGAVASELLDHPEYKLLKFEPKNYKAEVSKGEKLDDFQQRVMKAFNDIVKVHENEEANILLVAHGMTLTLLTAIVRGLPWYEFRNPELHEFAVNTAISVIEVKDGKAELTVYNQQDHLS